MNLRETGVVRGAVTDVAALFSFGARLSRPGWRFDTPKGRMI
jgi:hypothetical protein